MSVSAYADRDYDGGSVITLCVDDRGDAVSEQLSLDAARKLGEQLLMLAAQGDDP